MTGTRAAGRALAHVECLAREIGPRGSCTVQERDAARYAREQLEGMGLEPEVEVFESARSAWRPYALALGAALLAAPVMWVGRAGAVIAVVVLLVVLVSILAELRFASNPLRWILPRGRSQNVWARVPARGAARRRVVLVGHLDTHRTPLVFSSRGWLTVFAAMMPVGILSILLLLAVAAWLVVSPGLAAPWMAGAAAVPLAAAFVLTLQADATPFTEGANDNATAVGTVLELAARLTAEPLDRTEVHILCSGCEEVGCYGADAFLRRHGDALRAPVDGVEPVPIWVTIDSVGGAGADLCVVERHRFLTVARTEPRFLRLLEEMGERDPRLSARPVVLNLGYTESHIAHRHRVPSVTFLHLDAGGLLPNWHQPSDTLANLDPDLLDRTVALIEEFLRAVDRDPVIRTDPEPHQSA
jgi:hypothetical protein